MIHIGTANPFKEILDLLDRESCQTFSYRNVVFKISNFSWIISGEILYSPYVFRKNFIVNYKKVFNYTSLPIGNNSEKLKQMLGDILDTIDENVIEYCINDESDNDFDQDDDLDLDQNH